MTPNWWQGIIYLNGGLDYCRVYALLGLDESERLTWKHGKIILIRDTNKQCRRNFQWKDEPMTNMGEYNSWVHNCDEYEWIKLLGPLQIVHITEIKAVFVGSSEETLNQ